MNNLINPNKAKVLSLSNYKAGDLVRLKCGGPKMVVLQNTTGPGGEERSVCVWHNADNGICEAAFPESVLVDAAPIFSDQATFAGIEAMPLND